MGLAVPLVQAGAGILQTIMQWYGLQQQKNENEKLNAVQQQEASADRALKKYDIAGTLAVQNRNADTSAMGAATQRMTARQNIKQSDFEMTQSAAQDKWKKQVSFINNLTNMLNQNPDAANRLMAIQKTRAA